jgi:hypothetical protein
MLLWNGFERYICKRFVSATPPATAKGSKAKLLKEKTMKSFAFTEGKKSPGVVLRDVHKLLIYTEYYRECPLVGTGTPPTPLPQASVPPPPPEPRGGGHTRLRGGGGGRGWGSPNSDDWRNSLALCLLLVMSIVHDLWVNGGLYSCTDQEKGEGCGEEVEEATCGHQEEVVHLTRTQARRHHPTQPG